jgi:DNA-binding transcriptional LysR family regulator
MAKDLNDTLLFTKVIETGSFTAAARALGVPKSTLSRKVTELEKRLGTRLLKRTTRKLGLTEAGTVYYEHGARIARQLKEAEAAVGQLNATPRGWLRFTAPYSLGSDCINPLLPEFIKRYPEVRVEMHLGNEPMDLVASDIDVAVRVGTLKDSTLIARNLATIETQLYASPDYLAQHGEPLHPQDLIHHRTLAYAKQKQGGEYTWLLSNGERELQVPISPVLVANDPPSLFNAAIAGVGLAMIPGPFGAAAVTHERLRRILVAWSGPTVEVNAVLPPGRLHAPKVRAFVDFLAEHLRLDTIATRFLCIQLTDNAAA